MNSPVEIRTSGRGLERVICNLETESKTHNGTEYAVFKKTIPDTFCLHNPDSRCLDSRVEYGEKADTHATIPDGLVHRHCEELRTKKHPFDLSRSCVSFD